jgi:sigma54-dependent transcription regulator
VPLNCTAIPAELLESELGHTRRLHGRARVGKFQAADEGTLFLDEIGDMDYPLQAKLLRVLQEGVIEPVGKPPRAGGRAHRLLDEPRSRAVHPRRRSQDLTYRLNIFQIRLPPLRERRTFRRSRPFLEQFSRAVEARVAARPRARSDRAIAGPATSASSKPHGARGGAELGRRDSPALLRSLLPESAETGSVDFDRSALGVGRNVLRALMEPSDNKAAAAVRLGIGERTL